MSLNNVLALTILLIINLKKVVKKKSKFAVSDLSFFFQRCVSTRTNNTSRDKLGEMIVINSAHVLTPLKDCTDVKQCKICQVVSLYTIIKQLGIDCMSFNGAPALHISTLKLFPIPCSCPVFTSIPSYCNLKKEPGECCEKPVCEFSQQHGSFTGTGSTSGKGAGM